MSISTHELLPVTSHEETLRLLLSKHPAHPVSLFSRVIYASMTRMCGTLEAATVFTEQKPSK